MIHLNVRRTDHNDFKSNESDRPKIDQTTVNALSFWCRSPWKISWRLENLWYGIVIHSHVSPCLFRISFNIAWTGLFHHLLIPKQNHTVLVSWSSFFTSSSSIVGSVCWLSRILPWVGKTFGARFAVYKALA
jgi:hypothetical protein